jgi:peptidoglycan/LPS O-acetylase OafA/YrhL
MNSLNNLLFHRITPGIFRLILALLVVLYHTIGFLPIGPFSVYVFFVLSGYWIFRMYVEKYSKFENPYATFVKSRLYRLMPVYLLILVISILIYLIVPELRGKFLDNVQASPRSIFNLFCLGLNFSNFRVIGPAWSLDVEIQFYMMAPLMLLLIGSKKKNSNCTLGNRCDLLFFHFKLVQKHSKYHFHLSSFFPNWGFNL